MGDHDFLHPAETDVREVELKSGPARLRALLAVPASPCGWVIFAHEGGASLHGSAHRSVARALNQAGLATLSMELLTAAEAVNRKKAFETPLLAERLMAGAEWLGAESGAGVGCFGAGEGASAALWAAGERGSGIESVVACAPRLDLAAERLGDVQAPTLLIVGGADRRALKQVRWARKRLGSSELIVVPGATRLFDAPAALRALADRSVQWFKHTVSGGAEALEAARAGLSRETRRRLAAAASLLMLGGFVVGPKLVNAAVTAAWDSAAEMLRVTYTADGDRVTIGASGGQVVIPAISDLVPTTLSIAGGPVNAADVKNIRIGGDPSGTEGEPGNSPAGNQLADLGAVSAANGFTGLATTGQPISVGAGAGNDTILGSPFGDLFWGRGGNDVAYGNDGPDIIDGQDGPDFIDGGAGDDSLTGGVYDDTIYGGTGNDTLIGTNNNDFLDGGEGNDVVDGTFGIDTVLGGEGDDDLRDRAQTDDVTAVHDGGPGTDTFRAYARPGNDNSCTMIAGAGDVTIATANADYNGVWTYVNVEILRFDGTNNTGASAGSSDLLIGSGSSIPVSMQGLDGSDIMTGSPHADTLNGEAGDDTIDGAAGNDVVNGGPGINALSGGDGDDDVRALAYNTSAAAVHDGGPGTNQFRVSVQTPADTLWGPTGNNTTLRAGAGDVTIAQSNADPGNFNGVWTYLSCQSVRLEGAGVDTLAPGQGNDLLDATNSSVAAYLAGNAGNDSLIGSASNDTLDGGNQNDTINGGAGDDSLNGGNGNDALAAGAGNDTVNGGNNADTLDGGADNDCYVFGTTWGVDALSDSAGNDTADFALNDNAGGLTVDFGGSVDARAGANMVSTAEAIENVIGGLRNDWIKVVPSASTTLFADGGGGDSNRLSYDGTAQSGGVTVTPGPDDTTPGTISGGGVRDVLYLNFAEVNTLLMSNARVWQVFE